MNRLVTACMVAALSFQLAATGMAAKQSDKPNVLMICIDDLNDWTGFLGGHPEALTPHMDALAKRGRNFSNAHCAVPVCSASRASVISGVAATTHGSYELGPKYEALPALNDVPTIQRYFKDNGYVTLSGGKVLHHGFNGRLAGAIDRSLGRKKSPRPRKPMNRPSDWSGAWDWGAYPEKDDEMADVQLARSAAAALQEEFDQPFFMSVGFFRPHVPLFVPPKWFDLYDAESFTLPQNPKSDLDDLPKNFLGINDYAVAPTHAQVVEQGKQRSLTHAYLASISFVDHCVGIVLDALKSGPHAENTVIVLWSDHGFHLGEKQHWAKRTLWEESTRVPLLFAGPAIKPGEACPESASLIDIYPTLVELCKLPANPKLEGLSLVSQLNDPATPRDRPAITSSYFGNHSIRSRDWRLIVYNDGAEELYDHRNDPDEFDNLADDPTHKAIRDQLFRWVPKKTAPEFKAKSERSRGMVASESAKDKRPNFVVIFTDDQGYGDLSCFGGKHVSTPRIDQMAAEGSRLTSFYVAAPVCTPSRAALMTGCYPKRIDMAKGSNFGVLLAGDTKGLNPNEITIAEVLKSKGYKTAIFGKWHLGDQPDFLPTRQGFDEYFGIPYSHDIHPFHPKQISFQFPPLALLENETVIEMDPDADLLTRQITEHAVSFIENNRDDPFFLYIPHPIPHRPLHVSPPFMKGVASEIKDKLKNEGDSIDYDTRNRLFRQAIAEIDWSVGQILDTLKAQGLDDETLVVFTSDNGPAVGSAGPLRGRKGSTFEGGMRESTVIRWPGRILPGKDNDELMTTMDLFPTFAKLAGAEIPMDRVIDGKDIWPTLTGQARTPHEAFFYHRKDQLQAVRSGNWKLHATDGKPTQLYDLKNDIGEKKNLIKTEHKVVQRLSGLMTEFTRDIAENSRPAAFVENAKPLSK